MEFMQKYAFIKKYAKICKNMHKHILGCPSDEHIKLNSNVSLRMLAKR